MMLLPLFLSVIPSVSAPAPTITQTLYVNSMNNASTQWQTDGASPYLNNATGKHDIYLIGGTGQGGKLEGNFGFAPISVLYSSITSVLLYVESGHNGSGVIGNSAYVYNASGTQLGPLSPGNTYTWTMINLTSTFNTMAKISRASFYFQFVNVSPSKPLYIDRMYLSITGTVYPPTSRDRWAQLLWSNDTAAKVNSTFPFVFLGSQSLTKLSQEELLSGALLSAQTGDNSSLAAAESVAVWLNQTAVKKHIWFAYNTSSGWQTTPISPAPGAGVIERLAVYANMVPKWKPLLQQVVNEWIRIYVPTSTARVHLAVWPNDTVYLDPAYAYRDYCVATYQSAGITTLTLASAVLQNSTLQNLAYRMIMNYTNYDPVRAPHHLSTHAIYPNGTLDLSTYYFSKEDEDYASYMGAMETFYYYYPQNTTVKSRIYDQAWDGGQAMWNSTGQDWNYRTDIRTGSLDLTSGPPYLSVHGFGMTDEVLIGAYLIFGNTTWLNRARQDFDSLVIQGKIMTHGLIDHSTYHPNAAQESWDVHGRRAAVILYDVLGNQTYIKWANMLFWNVTGQMQRKYGIAEAVNPSTGADLPSFSNTREPVGEFLQYVNKTAAVNSFHSLFKILGLPITGIAPPPPPKWLSVTLDGPNGISQTSLSVQFYYTPYVVSAAFTNASLWTNSSGIWQRVATVFSAQNLTVNSLTYTYSSAGNYLWNIKVYNGTLGVFASANNSISIMAVNASPSSIVMDLGQSRLFASSIVGGIPPFTYRWYLDGVPVSGATSSTWLFTPSSMGAYTVYVNATDSYGTTAKSNVVPVTVNPPPTVNISPSSFVMDAGQTRPFSSNASGGTVPYSYQWYLDDAPVPGATSEMWMFSPASAGSHFVYVNLTDSVGFSVKSNVASVTVNPPPTVTVSPASATIDAGQSQLFTSNASEGTPPYSYQWFLDGIPVSGATSSAWTVTSSSAGAYAVHVEVIDSVEFQISSNTVTVTINPVPSVSISPPSATLFVGQPQLFTSNATNGTTPYTYQWYLNDAQVLGATDSTWTFTPALPGPYNVQLRLTDNVGVQATSNVAYVGVNVVEGHEVAVSNVVSSKTIISQGYSTHVNVTVANYGSYSETFMVTAYANGTSIGSQNVTLSSGNSTTITFIWSTASFARGRYTLSAYASPVPGETDTSDNTFMDPTVVKVTIPGDVNGDGRVDISDAALLGLYWLQHVPPASSNVDINGDRVVDISDAAIVGMNWLKHS